MSNGTTVTEKKPIYCKWCGRVEITFSDAFKSKSGKFIPIEKANGVPHKCTANPNNQQQQQPQRIETSFNLQNNTQQQQSQQQQQNTQQSSMENRAKPAQPEQTPINEVDLSEGGTATTSVIVNKVLEMYGIPKIMDKLIGLESKIDHLTKLVFAKEEKEKKQE